VDLGVPLDSIGGKVTDSKIATVDRGTKLPANPYYPHYNVASEIIAGAAYERAQIDMVNEGWVKKDFWDEEGKSK